MSRGKKIIQCPKCGFTFDVISRRTFACSECPLSFNVAWQRAQNVITNFHCQLHKEVPILIFTDNSLEEISDQERK